MITVIYVIPMVDIVVWDNICYAFTVVLDLLWLVILWRYSMMHVMVWFMHNALFIFIMRWLTPPSVDRWERCGHTHEIWIIALVFRILSIMKYDVCGYWVANVTEGIGIEWHSTVQHPLSGGKKGEVWCGCDSNHASLTRVTLATQMSISFNYVF
jgi:hypothetical protein